MLNFDGLVKFQYVDGGHKCCFAASIEICRTEPSQPHHPTSGDMTFTGSHTQVYLCHLASPELIGLSRHYSFVYASGVCVANPLMGNFLMKNSIGAEAIEGFSGSTTQRQLDKASSFMRRACTMTTWQTGSCTCTFLPKRRNAMVQYL